MFVLLHLELGLVRSASILVCLPSPISIFIGSAQVVFRKVGEGNWLGGRRERGGMVREEEKERRGIQFEVEL